MLVATGPELGARACGCHWCGDSANLCNLADGHGGGDTSVVPVADTPRRLQVRRADVNLLLIETTQEMARHSDTLTRGSGSVPFFSQVIPQL